MLDLLSSQVRRVTCCWIDYIRVWFVTAFFSGDTVGANVGYVECGSLIDHRFIIMLNTVHFSIAASFVCIVVVDSSVSKV